MIEIQTYDQFRRWVHLKTEEAYENYKELQDIAAVVGATEIRLLSEIHDNERLMKIEKLYYELLYQVVNKYPGESRHETAIRLIKQTESSHSSGSSKLACCEKLEEIPEEQ